MISFTNDIRRQRAHVFVFESETHFYQAIKYIQRSLKINRNLYIYIFNQF